MTARLSQDDINKLASLIGTDWHTADRTGFYLEYYNLLKQYAPSNGGNNFSTSDLMLLQASISSYSGFAGGGALLGNALAKFANPDLYNISLDEFSWDVAAGLFASIKKDWLGGGSGIFSTSDVFSSDNDVWQSKGLLEYFPGQAIEYNFDYTKLFTAGTLGGALSGLELIFGAQIGFTEADRIGQGVLDTSNPDYTVIRNPAGRVIWVQENVGALDRIFVVPQSVLNNPGQGLVDLISNYFGVDKSTALSALNYGDSALNSQRLGVANANCFAPARKRNLATWPRQNNATGKSPPTLSSPLRKNIPLVPSGKSVALLFASHPTRGAARDRHETRGGMRWT
jgi:hypothetical protein